MADLPQEQIETECASLLQELGLSQYEAYVFVYLVRLGAGTAKDVADMDHIPRTRVYETVDTLHDAGLVDIQYSNPRKFTPVSRETAIRKLNMERETTVTELSELISQLEPVAYQSEEFGVWTVSGNQAVASRVYEFIDDAEDELIYMTVDNLLSDEHIDRLQAASDRGVDIYLGGVSEGVRDRIEESIPSVTIFETLWEWSDVGAGSLLITDDQTALVSVLTGRNAPKGVEETAIWGTGERNSLVVVLRTIFTWRLGAEDLRPGDE